MKLIRLNKVVFFFLLQIISVFSLTAQSKDELEQQAYDLLNEEEYQAAYSAFDALVVKYPKELDYKQKLGICCLKYTDKKDRAIEVFSSLKESTKDILYDYYLGISYQSNYKFTEAIKYLENYQSVVKKQSKNDENNFYDAATLAIQNCKNGIDLVEKKVIADITNIGAPINTDESEYVPCITTDESVMFYTYRGKKSLGGKQNAKLESDEKEGKYLEDVYVSYHQKDGTWSEPKSVMSINTNGNDAAISISADGKTIFSFKSTDKNAGDIYVSELNGQEFSKPIALNSNINSPNYWEGSCSISADGTLLYFASERPGGLGGRDIWVSKKINGEWGPATNLGAGINTPLDDDAPYIHPDGITLFFSSKGHQSIGGYDIMFTVKKENNWLPPKSMGLPLNTTEDDRYYVINSDGSTGYFSSNRAGGIGKQDIYKVTPGILGDKPIIALLKGVVYGNDKPISAKIEVLKIVQKENIGPFISNAETGKYLMPLSPGAIYRIKVSAQDFEAIEEDMDFENLNAYVEQNKDFYLYNSNKTPSDTIKTVNTNTTTPTTNTTVAVNTNTSNSNDSSPCGGNSSLPDFTPLKGKSLNDINVYQQLLSIAGNYCSTGLVFKVQVAAYRQPKNYNYSHIIDLGKVESNIYPDGITRFTQLEFTTIKDAEVHRQKAINKGQKDAWIVGFVNGKRYSLEELIMLDFLGKSIN
ncbi:MAG: hypothetical protein LCH32_06910 [Bacteroidetes bacterium]|jgi:tetratricopeptide (TPR) repeat protein|nr:hypothetical protein [Bacteroidota bacterium]